MASSAKSSASEELEDKDRGHASASESAEGNFKEWPDSGDQEKATRQVDVEGKPARSVEEQAENPLSWPQSRKQMHASMLNYLAFSSVFASSLYSSAIDRVSHDFSVSRTIAILPLSFYILGTALGPMVASPLSEQYGRKPVILTGLVAGCLFTLGAGFSMSIEALIVCRFFAGVFFSPPLGICAAAMADIFVPADRAVPLSICGGAAFLGPAIAPIIGGYVVSTYNWRWTQWLVLVFMAPCFLYGLMSETYFPVIQRRHATKKLANAESASTKAASGWGSARQAALKSLVRPCIMLATEPVVIAFCAYVGFNFGLNYAFFAAYPYVFSNTYGLSLTGIGLTFTGLAIGVLLGTVALVLVNKLIYIRQLGKARKTHGPTARLPPEERLYGALIGGPAIVLGLFMFAWTARSEISFYAPVVAEGLFGFGNVLVYSSASQYLVDHYGAERGASATAANTLVRYLLGFAFPLFITEVFAGLGNGWAGSLLALIALVLACIPWLMFKFGPWLRKSRS